MKKTKLFLKNVMENIKLFFIFRTFKKDKGTLAYFCALEENKQNLINIKAMRNCLKKIDIPKFWDVKISNKCLLIIHHDIENEKKEDNIFQNFNYLCKQVEQFGKVEKSFDNQYECCLSIDGVANIKYKDGYFFIKISQMQVDKCDIEWKEEMVKTASMSRLCKELLKN